VAGFIFDMGTSEVVGKFGAFLDPHDLAVTSDAREVSISLFWVDFHLSMIHVSLAFC
jgi:hypothetical protein